MITASMQGAGLRGVGTVGMLLSRVSNISTGSVTYIGSSQVISPIEHDMHLILGILINCKQDTKQCMNWLKSH